MAIKTIVMDIDGTLLTSEKKISPKTRQALVAAQKQGLSLILASGRPTNGMRPLADELEMAHYNGHLLSFPITALVSPIMAVSNNYLTRQFQNH